MAIDCAIQVGRPDLASSLSIPVATETRSMREIILKDEHCQIRVQSAPFYRSGTLAGFEFGVQHLNDYYRMRQHSVSTTGPLEFPGLACEKTTSSGWAWRANEGLLFDALAKERNPFSRGGEYRYPYLTALLVMLQAKPDALFLQDVLGNPKHPLFRTAWVAMAVHYRDNPQLRLQLLGIVDQVYQSVLAVHLNGPEVFVAVDARGTTVGLRNYVRADTTEALLGFLEWNVDTGNTNFDRFGASLGLRRDSWTPYRPAILRLLNKASLHNLPELREVRDRLVEDKWYQDIRFKQEEMALYLQALSAGDGRTP